MQNLNNLLKQGETQVPVAVQRCADFLRSLGIWHLFSRNVSAESCADAASKRNRLGFVGYPMRDELKTFCGHFTDQWGEQGIVLAHCRGDREIDLEKVAKRLKSAQLPTRADQNQLSEMLHMSYGTVTPFIDLECVTQVFDQELRWAMGSPGTVMTNAGDKTWAVEFYPEQLVAKVNATWGDIYDNQVLARHNPMLWGPRKPKTIGIITGNPGQSGLDLQASIYRHTQSLLGKMVRGDVAMPEIISLSDPAIGISMELAERCDPIKELLIKASERITRGFGANIIAHPAHTTNFFTGEIEQACLKNGAKFISLVKAVTTAVKSHGLTEVALLGTEYVAGLGSLSAYRYAFEGITVHKPSAEGFDTIKRLGYEIQQNGVTSRCHNWMRDLLQREVPKNCKHVLLLMTEFTPLIEDLNPREHLGLVLIDPMDTYGKAIAQEWFDS